jgi:hypothetical protein
MRLGSLRGMKKGSEKVVTCAYRLDRVRAQSRPTYVGTLGKHTFSIRSELIGDGAPGV